MNCHLLIEVAHMLHRIRPSIVDGESWLWKRWGSLALLILLTNGDFEIWWSALLIASFPMLWWVDPCPHLSLPFSSLSWREDVEKDLLDGDLDLWLYERSLLSLDPSLDGGDRILLSHSLRRSFLRKWSISSCNFYISWSYEKWLPILQWLLSIRSIW